MKNKIIFILSILIFTVCMIACNGKTVNASASKRISIGTGILSEENANINPVFNPDNTIIYSSEINKHIDGLTIKDNTLILENYNEPDTIIYILDMGDDFKVNIVGENTVKAIDFYVWSLNNSVCSPHFCGDGTLNILGNDNPPYESISLNAAGTSSNITIAKDVKLNINVANEEGSEIIVKNSNLNANSIVFEDNDELNKCTKYEETDVKYATYANLYFLYNNKIDLCKCIPKDSTKYPDDEYWCELSLEKQFFKINEFKVNDDFSIKVAEPYENDGGSLFFSMEDFNLTNITPSEDVYDFKILESCIVYRKENDENRYYIREGDTDVFSLAMYNDLQIAIPAKENDYKEHPEKYVVEEAQLYDCVFKMNQGEELSEEEKPSSKIAKDKSENASSETNVEENAKGNNLIFIIILGVVVLIVLVALVVFKTKKSKK